MLDHRSAGLRVLITGGAGFIGSNVAAHYLAQGARVRVVDDLSRRGSAQNLAWLRSLDGNLDFRQIDIGRDREALDDAVDGCDVVFHLAAQVAVTVSVLDPELDFRTNVVGTFHLLESVRRKNPDAIVLYASTNKVYGGMESIRIVRSGERYVYAEHPDGLDEATPLDFHSPYGCSKGAAEQYVRDYARIYGIRTVCFRQSCIYGERQFGMEDQGWVAWFTLSALFRRPVTLFGDGRQVRDVLYVGDLLDAYQAAIEHIDVTSGGIYNVGGGSEHTLSLLELIDLLERITGNRLEVSFADWRPGDQPVYIGSTALAQEHFGFRARTAPGVGVARLAAWCRANAQMFMDLGIHTDHLVA